MSVGTHYGDLMAANKFPNGLDFNVDVVAREYTQGNLVKTSKLASWKVLENPPKGLQYDAGKNLAQFAAKAVYSVAIVEVRTHSYRRGYV